MKTARRIPQSALGLLIAVWALSDSPAADIPELLADPWRIERGMWCDGSRTRQLFSIPSPPEPDRIEVTIEGEGLIFVPDEVVDVFELIEEPSPIWERRMPRSEYETSEADLERRARQELIDLQRFGTGTIEHAIRW